jgi:hypothetical protein
MHDEADGFLSDLTIHNYDWREGSPLANAFVDQFLLSLIRAHPMQGTVERSELARLRDAKQSVFGIKPHDDLKVSKDLPMLQQMAREYVGDRGGGKFLSGKIEWGSPRRVPLRGIKRLAREVISQFREHGHNFSVMVTGASIESRLARKFNENKDELLAQVVTYGGLEVDVMSGWHEKVQLLFGPFLIPVAAPDDPVQDLKKLF